MRSSAAVASPTPVVGEGLRLVASRSEPTESEKPESLRAAIQAGIADIERGRFVEFDNDEDLRAHIDELVGTAFAS